MALLLLAANALLYAFALAEQGRGRRLVTAVSSAVVLVSLISGAWFLGQRAADEAAAGNAVQLGIGPIRIGPGARPVRVEGLDTAAFPQAGPCPLLLGSSGGVTVVVIGETAWRLPAEVVTSTSRVCTLDDLLLRNGDLPAGWTTESAERVELLSQEGLWACGRAPTEEPREWFRVALRRNTPAGPVVAGFQLVRQASRAELDRLEDIRRMLSTCPSGWDQPYESAGEGYRAHVGPLQRVEVAGLDADYVAWTARITITDHAGAVSADTTSLFATVLREEVIVAVKVAVDGGDRGAAEAIVRSSAQLLEQVTVN